MPAADHDLSADDIEAGRLMFAQGWSFVLGSPDLDHLPPDDRAEIAFAGRSNVGKSSLINALVGQHGLARASNTPGRTQELNFFTGAGGSVYLVDMPGYGFADAPKEKVATWNAMLRGFLAGRRPLQRVYVLIDARHGAKSTDHDIMTLLDKTAVSYQVVLTKADKISSSALAAVTAKTRADIARHPAAHPEVVVTSADSGYGIDVLRALIARLLAGRG
jgi:GTP-binding protein